MRQEHKFSFYCLLFCGAFLCYCSFIFYPKWKQYGAEATIGYDVAGYYEYLPALFIYHDLDHLQFQEAIWNKYAPAPGYPNYDSPDGNKILKYPAGEAVMYAPLFFIAHGVAAISDYPADGYSRPYQAALSWGCLLYALIGLLFLRRILLRYFSDTATGIVILLLVLGTNYLNYGAIDNAMTHNQLFTLYCLLIYFTIRFYETAEKKYIFLCGILCGLATITRPTEIISVLIPLLWGVHNLTLLKTRITFFLRDFRYFLIFFFAACAVGIWQLIYWHSVSGHFFEYSYEDQTFSWLHPHLKDGLFSYKKGWFVYTPLMLLIIPGFFYLYKKQRSVFYPLFFFTLLNIYIAFAWDIWWYGGSLGQRSMVQSYAILSFPLASCIEGIRNRKLIVKLFTGMFAAFCIWLNCVFTYQAHAKGGGFEAENMSRTYFWKTFGKLHPDPEDKKFLDTNEEFKGTKSNIDTVYKNDFETDTMQTTMAVHYTGNRSVFVNKENQQTPDYYLPQLNPENWITLSAWFYFDYKEYNIWQSTQFIIQFLSEGKIIKTRFIRIQRIMEAKEWKQLSFDVDVPDNGFDSVRIHLWNGGSGIPVYMDNLEVITYQ